MKVLVTGGCGFIGSCLVKKLHSMNVSVDVVDDMRSGTLDKLSDLPTRVIHSALLSAYKTVEQGEPDRQIVRVFESDFAHHLILDRIASGTYDYVFHLAADPRVQYSVERPLETTENNVSKTLALMLACSQGGVKRFIFSSSCSVYGNGEFPSTGMSEAQDVAPESPYAIQKLTIDHMLPIFYKYHNLDSVALRYFNVYGPGHDGSGAYSTAVAAWCNALKNGNALRSDGDGTQSRDMIFVDDVADANIAAMKSASDLQGSPFNICTGDSVSNNEILAMIEDLYGHYERRNAPWRPGDVMHTLGNPIKSETDLKFKAKTNFRTGLLKTMKWWGFDV